MELKKSKHYTAAVELCEVIHSGEDKSLGGLATAEATLALAEQMERIADRLDEMVRFQAGV